MGIIAIGLDSDETLLYFLRAVRNSGTEVTAINLRAVAAAGRWRICAPDDGRSWVQAGDCVIPLHAEDAFYVRLIDLSTVQSAHSDAQRWRHLLGPLSVWLESTPTMVINRPGAHIHNCVKPLHEHVLASLGLQVPAGITSADPCRLRSFIRSAPGGVIAKAISGIRANSRLVRAEDVPDSPGQPIHLQHYIEGIDVRVHVVADECFGEGIESDMPDYRASKGRNRFFPITVEPKVQRDIVRATRTFDLEFAGWDFKIDRDGVWWCLEANPMPGYSGYDRRAGGMITAALVRRLSSPHSGPRQADEHAARYDTAGTLSD